MSKELKYIDIHGHVNFDDYDSDKEEVIKRAADAGVGMITVGTDIETSKKAIELAEAYPNMWATVGIHPNELENHDVNAPRRAEAFFRSPTDVGEKKGLVRDGKGRRQDYQDDFQELRKLALHPKVVAVGECGLDYFRSGPSDIPAQAEAFERHIAIANEAKKPLMLHVRNGKKKGDSAAAGGDAYKDALDILKKSAQVPFNFHFFAGTIGDMKEIFEQGGTVSFTGVITFTHDYDELIKTAPLDRIMVETDCPYVAPAPYRGTRNEPAHVIEAARAVARIRGEDEDKVRQVLFENALSRFNLR